MVPRVVAPGPWSKTCYGGFNLRKSTRYQRARQVGDRVGILTLRERQTTSKSVYFKCECECGNFILVRHDHLFDGATLSCGCRGYANLIKHGESRGHTVSKEYAIYAGMKQRCYNTNHKHFKSYGGRGITVCSRWLNSFAAFLEDMGRCPEGMSLDRIENNGHYEPDNCRWATALQQARNKRTNLILTAGLQSMTLSEWSEKTGIGVGTIQRRLKLGWTTERAVSQPVKRKCG